SMPPNLDPTPVAPDNRPGADDRVFSAFEMKGLLHGGLVADATATGPFGNAPVMAANAMKSQLGGLLPFNFNDPLDIAGSLRRRSLVTTLSMDVNRAGMSPWMWNPDAPDALTNQIVSTQVQPRTPPIVGDNLIMSPAPWGNPATFPSPATFRGNAPLGNPIPPNSEFNIPSPPAAPVGTGPTAYAQSNWRAATQAVRQILGRIDLSRPLQPDPHPLNPANQRFDVDAATNGPVYTQFLAAQADRQTLASEIYRALRRLTGVQSIDTTNPNFALTGPSDAELQPRRWLAQLAVNIVDFV